MAGSLRQYSSSESNNAALGQAGSVFATGNVTIAPASGVFVAITMVATTMFDALTPEDGLGKQYVSSTTPSDSGTGGQAITTGGSGTQFPEGLTIYGRWSEINLNDGTIIAYLG